MAIAAGTVGLAERDMKLNEINSATIFCNYCETIYDIAYFITLLSFTSKYSNKFRMFCAALGGPVRLYLNAGRTCALQRSNSIRGAPLSSLSINEIDGATKSHRSSQFFFSISFFLTFKQQMASFTNDFVQKKKFLIYKPILLDLGHRSESNIYLKFKYRIIHRIYIESAKPKCFN